MSTWSDLSKLSDVPTDDWVHDEMAWSLPGHGAEPALPEHALDEAEKRDRNGNGNWGLEVSQEVAALILEAWRRCLRQRS